MSHYNEHAKSTVRMIMCYIGPYFIIINLFVLLISCPNL